MSPAENHLFDQLPILPEDLLRQHHVHQPLDGRFCTCARLLQSLWRQRHGLPLGSYRTPEGVRRKLGSRITPNAGRRGANFLSPAVASLVRREVAYREIGAMVNEHRLYTNLLSSMPLTFNLFGPLRLDLSLATRVFHVLSPDLREANVRAIMFEHSPGRGSPLLTADFTAFDSFITYELPNGRTGFVGVELKYSESCSEPKPDLSVRYDEIADASGLFIDPTSPALRKNPLQQFFRLHGLAEAMLTRGDYDEGRFIVIAPRLNHLVQNAIGAYRCQLNEPTKKHVGFASFTLEQVVQAIGLAGEPDYARELYFRYLDWHAVDEVLEDYLSAEMARRNPVEGLQQLKLAPPGA